MDGNMENKATEHVNDKPEEAVKDVSASGNENTGGGDNVSGSVGDVSIASEDVEELLGQGPEVDTDTCEAPVVAGTSKVDDKKKPGTLKTKAAKGTGGTTTSAKKKAKMDDGPAAASSSGGGNLLQFKVTLKGSKPPIWRRILIEENDTFYDLHMAIQRFMGWCNGHLHEFTQRNLRIGTLSDSDDEEGDGIGMFQGYFGDKPYCEKKTKLKDYFIDIKSRFTYQYDFGDSWDHDVVLEKILPIMPNNIQVYPQCNQGKRACPPEDCGGLFGFYELLETWEKPKKDRTSEEQERLEHYGLSNKNYDPAKYVPCGAGFIFI